MFPYTFPALVIVWTMLTLLSQGFEVPSFVIMIIFLFVAKKYYREKPKTNKDKASAIALNFAVLPLILINGIFLPYLLQGKRIGESGMAYLLPMIYSPIIYLVIFAISFIVLWRMNKH